VGEETLLDWKTKSQDPNAVFSDYMVHLDELAPSAEDVIKSFPVYVGYVSLARYLAFYELYKKVLDLPGHIAEIGTFHGASLVFFGKLIRLFEPHNYTQAHGFDWFQGMKPTADDNHSGAGNWVGDYERLQQLVARQQLEDCVVIHKMDVTKDLSAFLDDHRYMRFKLAFIDCGVRDVITKSLECLWPRLVKGGILVMDHYNTAVSPLESELVEQCIGDRPIQKISFSRQPTGYVVK
jgi:hypothetical protein